MKIGNYIVNFKKFNNHSNDKIMFWSNPYCNSASIYFFDNSFNQTMTFHRHYKHRPFFLLNVQIFFVGV